MSNRYAKACANKHHYRSERRATEAAKESQKKFGIPLNAYECEFHPGQWVVGSTFPQNSRERRNEKSIAKNLLDIVVEQEYSALKHEKRRT